MQTGFVIVKILLKLDNMIENSLNMIENPLLQARSEVPPV